MEDKLTFKEEVSNVIACLEYLMKRVGDMIVEYSDSMSEDEMVNDDAKKALEFLYDLKEGEDK